MARCKKEKSKLLLKPESYSEPFQKSQTTSFPKNNVSKHNSIREKQVVLLIILNGEGWHYIAVKRFIDSARFLASSLSNLANNLAEEIHKINYKYGNDDKTCEIFGIKYKDCDYYLEYKNVKDDLIEDNCLCCNKNYQNKFDEILKKRFTNTYIFSNLDINKFILLLKFSLVVLEVYPGNFSFVYIED